MKKNKILFFIFIISIFGCKNIGDSNNNVLEKKQTIDQNLITIIDNYIIENPLKSNRIVGKSSTESGFSYPSYHLFFNKKGKDTVFSIVLFPSYNNFELEGITINDNEITYQSIEHKGWIMYKEKYPLIVFDNKDYSSSFIESDKLSIKIPDSLQAGYNNQHIEFVKWDFKIDNGKFKRIPNLHNFHTHPSSN